MGKGVISYDIGAWSRYSVLGTYESKILYYRVAAKKIVNKVLSSLFQGKDTPTFDQHRLVEMYQKNMSNVQPINNE